MLIRLWVADLLEENGFSVLEAKDADAAVELLESRPGVKLLFTDVQMAGSVNGMELAREGHMRWPAYPLGDHIGPRKADAREIPDDGRFVAKPYSREELLGQLNDLMHSVE
jgi:two-component system, response regulator PdtaR